MELEQYGRIIFININDLQKISFNKLEQVCDEVYVFANKEVKTVPLSLVQQLQHLGESIKWVIVNGNTEAIMANYISFYLGKLHGQLDIDIEFAIISENIQLDYLIEHINEKGRGCIRVTRNKEKTTDDNDLNGITWSSPKEEEKVPNATMPHSSDYQRVVHKVTNKQAIATKPPITRSNNTPLAHQIAKETIKRLVLSGNRPAALSSLKSYILLQYNNESVKQQINAIVQEMVKNKEIIVQNEEVIYNF